jgi:hypothetical protein
VATHLPALFTAGAETSPLVRRMHVSGGRVVEEARPWT